jgi:AcrR family transcriptional regulator
MTSNATHVTEIASRRARAGKNADYLARRDSILKQAAEVLHERGLNETSLADIAGATGLDRASIYYYFKNKEEIVAELMREALLESVEELERIAKSRAKPDEKLRRMIVKTMELFDRHYPQLFIYVREDIEKSLLSEELRDFFEGNANYSTSLYQNVIADGIRKGVFRIDLPIEIATAGLLGAVTSAHWWYLPGGDTPPEELGDGLARLLINGLRGREEAR